MAVGVAICLAVSGAGWGYVTWLAYSIERQRGERTDLKWEIERQQATVRELEQKTWGVGLAERENGRFLTLPEGSKTGWQIGDTPAVKLPDQ